MNWQLPIALLLTFFVASAYSECQKFADFVRQVNNTGRGNYKAEVSYEIKFQKSGSEEKSGSSSSSNAMQTSDKQKIETSLSAGGSFMGIGGSASVSYGMENEVKKQVSQIDTAQFKKMAQQAMGKKETMKESYDVPSGSGISVFQVRIVCDGYEMSLPKLITVMTAYDLPPGPPAPPAAPSSAGTGGRGPASPLLAASSPRAFEITSLLALFLSL